MRYLIITAVLALAVGCAKQPEPHQHPGYQPQSEYTPFQQLEVQPQQPVVPVEPEWTEKTFYGEWNTVRNRQLDGMMYCKMTRAGHERWSGKFWGTWHGVDFDYTVSFNGPLDNLVGEPVTIDGAHYQWTGKIRGGVFDAEFRSNRYDGSFQLKEQ